MCMQLFLNRSHLVSDAAGKLDTPIKINQDANIFVSEIEAGNSASLDIREGRQAYLLCMEGTAQIDGSHGSVTLTRHDAAEIYGANSIVAAPTSGAEGTHLLLVEMEYTGRGRTDL